MRTQKKTDSLTEAFDITRDDQIISVVGAGGKTTLIDFLAQELAQQGFFVGIMTTTHRYYPQKFDGIEKKKEEILEILKKEHVVEIGSRVQGEQQLLKTGPVSQEMYQWIKRHVDFLLVEADGAKRMMAKVPAVWEPVLYHDMKKVIVTAGLGAVGKKWKESCFRWDSYFSQEDGEKTVEADKIVQLMQSVYPKEDGRKWMFFFNQWDCMKEEEQKEKLRSAAMASRYPVRWGQLQKHSDKNIEIWRND